MKKVFTIYLIKEKDIHVPSGDHYSRDNESETDTITILEEDRSFDSIEEAEQNLLEYLQDNKHDYKYTILTEYSTLK